MTREVQSTNFISLIRSASGIDTRWPPEAFVSRLSLDCALFSSFPSFLKFRAEKGLASTYKSPLDVSVTFDAATKSQNPSLPRLTPLASRAQKSLAKMDHDDDLTDMVFTPPLSTRSGGRKRRASQTPQETLRQFWNQFNSKFPGRVYTVLPDNPYARTKAERAPKGVIQGQDAGKSYEEARKECRRAVDRIVKECERLNQKYTDPHFDIEVDLKSGKRNCLDTLEEENMEMRPRGVKRVTVSYAVAVEK